MGMCVPEKYKTLSFPPKHHMCPRPKGLCHSQDTPWMAPRRAQGALSPPAGTGLALRRGEGSGETGVADIWENLFPDSPPDTGPVG